MIAYRDSIFTVSISDVICSVSADTRNEVRVIFLQEGARFGKSLDLAVEVMNDSVRMKSTQHLVMVKLLEEEVYTVDKVDRTGTLIRGDITRCCRKDWRQRNTAYGGHNGIRARDIAGVVEDVI